MSDSGSVPAVQCALIRIFGDLVLLTSSSFIPFMLCEIMEMDMGLIL